jgi:hypothetical protein
MFRRSLLVVAAAATAVMLSTSAVGAAVRPFNPPQTVIGGCTASSGDSAMGSGGSLFGFAQCQRSAIRFFSRNPNGTVNPSQATGFSGRVLGVTFDNTAAYVLFATSVDIRIGKRTTAGAFSSRVVDTGLGGGTLPTGDVIATNGQWFGVWSKQVGPGGEFAQTELFSAGSTLPVRQVTVTGANVDDSEPTLAYSASTPVLIWSRIRDPFIPGPSDLYKAKFLNGAWEAPQLFASAGTNNFVPDMAIAGGRTFVTWNRDGFVWVASNASGSFTSRMFNTGGFLPNVTATTTGGFPDHIFVAWTAFGATPGQDRVFFAESASTGSVHGTWNGAYVAPVGTLALGVGGAATKGTVTYANDPANLVAIRSQT